MDEDTEPLEYPWITHENFADALHLAAEESREEFEGLDIPSKLEEQEAFEEVLPWLVDGRLPSPNHVIFDSAGLRLHYARYWTMLIRLEEPEKKKERKWMIISCSQGLARRQVGELTLPEELDKIATYF
jgi:hypothetical protein